MLDGIRQDGDVNGAEAHGAETHSAITHDDENDMTTMRIRVVAIALSVACGPVLDAGSTQRPGKDQNLSDTTGFSKRMADGKEWTTSNLNVNTPSRRSGAIGSAGRVAADRQPLPRQGSRPPVPDDGRRQAGPATPDGGARRCDSVDRPAAVCQSEPRRR